MLINTLYIRPRTSNWSNNIILPPLVTQYKLAVLCFIAMRTFTALLAPYNCGSKSNSGSCVWHSEMCVPVLTSSRNWCCSWKSCSCSDGHTYTLTSTAHQNRTCCFTPECHTYYSLWCFSSVTICLSDTWIE